MRKCIQHVYFFYIFVLIFTPISSAYSQDKKSYITAPESLSVEDRKLYDEAYNLLNNWSGQYSNLVAAGEKINKFIKIEPNFLPIYIEKARLSILMGVSESQLPQEYGAAALDIINEIKAKAPDYPKPYVLAGHVHSFMGNYDLAKSDLEKAQQLGTNDPWLYLNWSDLMSRQGNYKLAMAYSKQGFDFAADNNKALYASIEQMTALKPNILSSDSDSFDLPAMVMSKYSDPKLRINIAEIILQQFRGDNYEVFIDAKNIIDRQRAQTPDCQRCDYADVMLILKNGFRVKVGSISIYDEQTIKKARSILVKLQGNEELKDHVFVTLANLAMSEKDYKKLDKLYQSSKKYGVSSHIKKAIIAKFYLAQGEIEKSMDVFNEIAKTYPDIKYFNDDYTIAYTAIMGGNLWERQALNEISMDPLSAWPKGNYASRLLHFNGDFENAIKYSREALKIMDYGVARKTLAMSLYLKWATILMHDGSAKEAQSYYDEAYSILPDLDYVSNEASKSEKTMLIVEALNSRDL